MPTSSTLSLGQSTFELLDVVGFDETASIRSSSSTLTVQALKRGGLINGEINDTGSLKNLNFADRLSNFLYTNNSNDIGSKINLLADTDSSTFELGTGDNRFNAARNLLNSGIQVYGGDNNIRIGGSADESVVSTGDGVDRLTINRESTGLDVAMGGGDDTALFLGTLKAGNSVNASFNINDGYNLVNMGAGDDSATFLGGVQGGEPGTSGYEIQLGDGNDSVVFGPNSLSNGFVLNTGTGSDTVRLGRTTDNAIIDLGWDNGGSGYTGNSDLDEAHGDLVILGVGASLENSYIRSGQSNDTLRLAGTVTDTSLDLGWGNSLVEVDGVAGFGTAETTVWNLGGGDDTLHFGVTSDVSLLGDEDGFISLGIGADLLELLGTGDSLIPGGIEFDLGNDNDIDVVRFSDSFGYSNITISNFGTNDVLFIGLGSYGYGYEFLNVDANIFDLDQFRLAGNVIWSHTSDGDSTDQEIMTYDDTLVLSSDDTETALLLRNAAYWGGSEAPLSENPPQISFPDSISYG